MLCKISFLWALAFLLLCSTAYCSESTFDVIPDAWISYDGCHPQVVSDDKRCSTFIFPSLPGPSSNPVEFTARGFLTARNRIKEQECFSLPNGGGSIKITRKTAKDQDLQFHLDPASVSCLRRQSWEEFRQTQEQFKHWILHLSFPELLPKIFRDRDDEFIHFDVEMRRFWVRCLRDANFERYAGNVFQPIERYSPDNQSTPGKMGAVPLRSGMRLQVHWGGTADYPFGVTESYYSRQTSAGLTTVTITSSGSGLYLASPQEWRVNTILPFKVKSGNNPFPPPLPFGNSNTASALSPKVLPVFNDYDLRQFGIDRTRHITLLIPYEYPKADLAQNGPRRENDVSTDDALGSDDLLDKPFNYGSLARRFVLWYSDSSYDHASPPAFDDTNIPHWPHPAMIFGNQSWIDVESPVSLNGASTEWVPLGATVKSFLEIHARWLLARSPDYHAAEPIFCLHRVKESGSADASASYHAREYRFWCLPISQMASLELQPADALFFKP